MFTTEACRRRPAAVIPRAETRLPSVLLAPLAWSRSLARAPVRCSPSTADVSVSPLLPPGGFEVSVGGDNCPFAFPDAGAALAGCASAQRALSERQWQAGLARPTVAMALHTGSRRASRRRVRERGGVPCRRRGKGRPWRSGAVLSRDRPARRGAWTSDATDRHRPATGARLRREGTAIELAAPGLDRFGRCAELDRVLTPTESTVARLVSEETVQFGDSAPSVHISIHCAGVATVAGVGGRSAPPRLGFIDGRLRVGARPV